jgi:hypothetical protein
MGWRSQSTVPVKVLYEPDAGAHATGRLKSCLCTQAQLESGPFRAWLRRMGFTFKLRRKRWEFAFIAQALHEHGMLQPGRRGLGFAVGREPLSALFAGCGCEIVATDLDETRAEQLGWATTNQHAARLDDLITTSLCDLEYLNMTSLCDPAVFHRRVTFRVVDMNDIPGDLRGFDFTWSSCSFEHLGSIAHGRRFLERMTRCLKPEGIAVHTTELNVSSNRDTIDNNPSLVIFRQRDVEAMAAGLQAQGRAVELDLSLGNGPADGYVAQGPEEEPHLKLQLGHYVATSFGFVIGPVGSHPAGAKGQTPGRRQPDVAREWARRGECGRVGHETTFPACSLPGAVGVEEGDVRVAREGSAPGFLAFGPYVGLPAGTYRVVLELADVTGPPGTPVATWDVGYFVGEPAATLRSGQVFPGAEQVEVQLTVPTDDCRLLEMRLYYLGRGTVGVRRLTILREK